VSRSLFKGLPRFLLPVGDIDNIDNKLNNCVKITGVLNNLFRPQKTLRKKQ
jgi:hypothetical protein